MSARNPSTSLRFLTRRMSDPFVFPLAGHLDKVLSVAEGERKGRKYSAAALTAFGEDLSLRCPPPPNFSTSASASFFTGKPHVAGLGHAFLFRNYRASLAKWQTADPLGYPNGWNQLAYCWNVLMELAKTFGGFIPGGIGKLIDAYGTAESTANAFKELVDSINQYGKDSVWTIPIGTVFYSKERQSSWGFLKVRE